MIIRGTFYLQTINKQTNKGGFNFYDNLWNYVRTNELTNYKLTKSN